VSVDRWVMRYRSRSGAFLRLFCFPYAGGGASLYRSWAAALPPEIDLCPIQLPGRETRLAEAPFERLAPLVAVLVEVVRTQCDLPFAFFGYSGGALIAFELSRELRRRRLPNPIHLSVAACRAPHVRGPASNVHRSTDAEFVEELRRLNDTPKDVLENQELIQLLLPTVRADWALNETYHFTEEEPLDCPITAVGGRRDTDISESDIHAWARHTRTTCLVRMLPGDHFFIHSGRDALLECLAHDLRDLLGPIVTQKKA